jgi:hypothetical protein
MFPPSLQYSSSVFDLKRKTFQTETLTYSFVLDLEQYPPLFGLVLKNGGICLTIST